MSKTFEFGVWLFTCFVSILGFVYAYAKITDAKKFVNWRFIILFVVDSLGLTCTYYFGVRTLELISYFIFCPIIFYFVKYDNIKKFIYYIFIVWIYALILDLIAMAIAAVVLPVYKYLNYWYLFESLMSVLLCTFLIIFTSNKKVVTITTKICEKLSNVKFFDISLLLFSMFTFLVGLVVFMNIKKLNVSILLTIVIFLMIIVFGILLKHRVNIIENEIFLKTLKENNEFYIKMVNENRVFRHNLNAKLMSVKSVSNNKAKVLLNEVLKENSKSIAYSKNIKEVPYGFNGIIYEKIYSSLDYLNITLVNDIDYDIFDVLKPRRYNVLVEKMIVALDNAIEACKDSNTKEIIINLYSNEGSIVIEIRNSFGNRINVDSIGNIGYSTKGKARGLGLFSILRNKEVLCNISILDDIFINKIVAKKNK